MSIYTSLLKYRHFSAGVVFYRSLKVNLIDGTTTNVITDEENTGNEAYTAFFEKGYVSNNWYDNDKTTRISFPGFKGTADQFSKSLPLSNSIFQTVINTKQQSVGACDYSITTNIMQVINTKTKI